MYVYLGGAPTDTAIALTGHRERLEAAYADETDSLEAELRDIISLAQRCPHAWRQLESGVACRVVSEWLAKERKDLLPNTCGKVASYAIMRHVR